MVIIPCNIARPEAPSRPRERSLQALLLHPKEKQKFIRHIKEKYGSVVTQITEHLGDMVVELSIYVNEPIANTFKKILNDIFTQRAETNMEKSDREDTEKEKDEGDH